MTAISASVGTGGVNRAGDVRIVQGLLNHFAARLELPPLPENGTCGNATQAAIRAFQQQIMGQAHPDGLVDPGGATLVRLAQSTSAPAPAADPALLSGAAWWHAHQADYENSRSLSDLASPFRENASRFIAAMHAAGASVDVSATRRNRIRAWLMHYSFRLARGDVLAGDIPAMANCPIRWDHGDEAKSRAAAKEMSDLFAIAFQPSLTSLHIEGRAVDMTIGWAGTLQLKDAAGALHQIGGPRDGSNPVLQAVGRGYAVIKLLSDPPHWSDNGH